MPKEPTPIPEPDVIRLPTPFEEPELDFLIELPEPGPDVERSPPRSTILHKLPPDLPLEP